MGENDILHMIIIDETGTEVAVELVGVGVDGAEDVTEDAYTGVLQDYDNNEYTEVVIGNQRWIVENLRTTHYSDGTAIPNITLAADWITADDAYCNVDNDEDNKELYGLLYNEFAIDSEHGLAYFKRNGVQEAGWRIPTDGDWDELIAFLGGNWGLSGGKAKSTGLELWKTPNLGATNESGLTLLPSGSRSSTTGAFRYRTERSILWSTIDGYGFTTNYGDTHFTSWVIGAKEGCSVRCVKTNPYNFVKYGLLYNWYAVNSSANIAAVGWHVPTYEEYVALISYLGGNDVAGGKLKEFTALYWNVPNTGATNEAHFNGRGSGYRHDDGSFLGIKEVHSEWAYGLSVVNEGSYFSLHTTSARATAEDDNYSYNLGYSARLVKDTTSLSHGQSSYYTGNDGKTYRTICIGTQEWVADNLAETKYRTDEIIYGYLYNWYAAADVRGICSAGWRISTVTDTQSLITLLGGYTVAGGKLKEVGLSYWDNPNVGATNDVGFNARGSGIRETTGIFDELLSTCNFYTLSANPILKGTYQIVNAGNIVTSGATESSGVMGCSLRAVRDATVAEQLLDDGAACDDYTGNDLKTYPTVKIGTQVWVATNLAETKYANGDDITEVTDAATWAALVTEARCSYDNDEDNTLSDDIPEVTDDTTWEGLTTGARCSYDNDSTNV